MEPSGVVSAVVDLLGQAAGGVGTAAVNSAVTTAVSELVQQRLGSTDRGRAVLVRLDQHPQDPATRDALRTALQQEVSTDQDFEAQLSQALAGGPPPPPSQHFTDSMVISGSKLRGNNISLGPLTISNTKKNRFALVAVAIVVAALLSLATYGGYRLTTGDESKSHQGDRASASKTPGEPTASSEGEGGSNKDGAILCGDSLREPGVKECSNGMTLNPEVSIDPNSGTNGTTVAVTASGFLPGEPVIVYLSDTRDKPVVRTTAGSDGRISVDYTIPDHDVFSRSPKVTVQGNTSGAKGAASFSMDN
ncbi:hypothetical protein [Streptomyces sp. PSAA01]|uniref:hypothetical protein n=1 Tax=Streptomyces sp. PSAA01 TaxID=2912762 RepID=UPI001F39BAA7|nr:hypothetical protein [Streptomyces sp. PSAA01]MCG0284025.1 hypothetical protein [Streptomyces sp. PSAA01]